MKNIEIIQPAILIVDTDQFVAEAIADYLRGKGYFVRAVQAGLDALKLLEEDQSPGQNGALKGTSAPIGVLITDLNLPDIDGIQLVRQIRKAAPSVVPMVLTAYGDIASAVEAIKAGASDFLTKPLMDDELTIALEKAVQHHHLLFENNELKHALNDHETGSRIIGNDPLMQKVYARMEAVGSGRSTVLIQGESGTGKSLIAKAIHEQSERREKPFVTFACGSIPESLLESELFGHVKGAFTGADYDKPGRLASSDGGTLFIDEINSATQTLQLKLLRVLQERQFEPVGSSKTQHVDIRFIIATNEPLEPLIAQKVFREDLYYRIKVVDIQLPPLRDRKDDLMLLAHHYLNHYAREMDKVITGMSPDVKAAILKHGWPGNVRELENAMERSVVLSRTPTIELEDIPEHVAEQYSQSGAMAASQVGTGETATPTQPIWPDWSPDEPKSLSESLLEPEKRILQCALDANDWNRQKTAQLLDINRTTLYKKIKQFNLSPSQELLQ